MPRLTAACRYPSSSIATIWSAPFSASALAFGERDPFLSGRAGVLGLGANEPVMGVLLDHVRAPTGHPADGEDRRAEVGGNPEERVRRRGVVVDVHDVHLLGRRG